MNLNEYFKLDDGTLSFEPARASEFAKQVAGDFNPLHNPSNKRFCVPGDLLFSVLLNQYGLNANFAVEFLGMVDGGTAVTMPTELGSEQRLCDTRDREVLVVSCSGEKTEDATFISELTEQYVRFSGKTFPDVLEPLMRDNNVMINPSRPLIIYQSMQLSLTALSGTNLNVELAGAELLVEGRKGTVQLAFTLKSGNERIGTGAKSMVLGGLRTYDAIAMQGAVDDYNALKAAS